MNILTIDLVYVILGINQFMIIANADALGRFTCGNNVEIFDFEVGRCNF